MNIRVLNVRLAYVIRAESASAFPSNGDRFVGLLGDTLSGALPYEDGAIPVTPRSDSSIALEEYGTTWLRYVTLGT